MPYQFIYLWQLGGSWCFPLSGGPVPTSNGGSGGSGSLALHCRLEAAGRMLGEVAVAVVTVENKLWRAVLKVGF